MADLDTREWLLTNGLGSFAIFFEGHYQPDEVWYRDDRLPEETRRGLGFYF